MSGEPGPPLSRYSKAELATYRRELEHALKTLPVESDVRQLLTKHLGLAVAEQKSRQAQATG